MKVCGWKVNLMAKENIISIKIKNMLVNLNKENVVEKVNISKI